MNKVLIALLLVVAVSALTVSPAFASGDQVRGDNGQGTVNQVQVQDPPPFQP
jgi:hypothetical protein